MNKPERHEGADAEIEETPGNGINLTLVYTLIGVALIAAMGFAALIVLPFYQRR